MTTVVLFDLDNTIGYFTPYKKFFFTLSNNIKMGAATPGTPGPEIKNTNHEIQLNVSLYRALQNVIFKPNIIATLKLISEKRKELNIKEINIFTANPSTSLIDGVTTFLEHDYGIKFDKIYQPYDNKKTRIQADLMKEYVPISMRGTQLINVFGPNRFDGHILPDGKNFEFKLHRDRKLGGNEDYRKSVDSLIQLYPDDTKFILFDDNLYTVEALDKNRILPIQVLRYFCMSGDAGFPIPTVDQQVDIITSTAERYIQENQDLRKSQGSPKAVQTNYDRAIANATTDFKRFFTGNTPCTREIKPYWAFEKLAFYIAPILIYCSECGVPTPPQPSSPPPSSPPPSSPAGYVSDSEYDSDQGAPDLDPEYVAYWERRNASRRRRYAEAHGIAPTPDPARPRRTTRSQAYHDESDEDGWDAHPSASGGMKNKSNIKTKKYKRITKKYKRKSKKYKRQTKNKKKNKVNRRKTRR